jgi:hypothetical protein
MSSWIFKAPAPITSAVSYESDSFVAFFPCEGVVKEPKALSTNFVAKPTCPNMLSLHSVRFESHRQ